MADNRLVDLVYLMCFRLQEKVQKNGHYTLLKEIEERETEKSEIIIRGQWLLS